MNEERSAKSASQFIVPGFILAIAVVMAVWIASTLRTTEEAGRSAAELVGKLPLARSEAKLALPVGSSILWDGREVIALDSLITVTEEPLFVLLTGRWVADGPAEPLTGDGIAVLMSNLSDPDMPITGTIGATTGDPSIGLVQVRGASFPFTLPILPRGN